MSKSVKYRSGFSQIIVLIILSVVAISSFVVASKLGNQSQELRSRAQTYTVSPTPFGVSIDCMSTVNPDNFCATANYCPTGFTKISGYCKNSGACCKKDLAPCISTANPNNFCATAAYCPEGGFTKILGYCSNGGACCKKDTLPSPKPTPTSSPIACMSTVNPDNFCATANYCPTGSTKISGYCTNSGTCCKRNPRTCLSPNVCHYGECSSGYSMVSDKCEGTNIVCCKPPKPSPTPSPNCITPNSTTSTCIQGSACYPGTIKNDRNCGSGTNLICCQKVIISGSFSSLTCDDYNRLIGWSCIPSLVDEVFKGQIRCPNGRSKYKGCRLYCDSNMKIKQDYCDWIPDNAITEASSTINGKKITWSFCPIKWRSVFTDVINYAIGIFPKRFNIEIKCNASSAGPAGLGGDRTIEMFCYLNDGSFNEKCRVVFVHELMHTWQGQENTYYSNSNGYENNDFNKLIGCRYDPVKKTTVFTKEDALSEYGRKHCGEALAEAARWYVYPKEDFIPLIDPAKEYKTKRPLQYGFMKGIFGREYSDYYLPGVNQFNIRTSPILNTNSF